jgi:hypothetical protein
MTYTLNSIWIFMGEGARFPSGVFISEENANKWIKEHELSGVLTQYPLEISTYDWAIKNYYFSPKKAHETSKEFIQKFTCASQKHYHYENGERE